MIAKSSNEAVNIIDKFNSNKLKFNNIKDIDLFLNLFIDNKNKNYSIVENIIKYY